MGLSAASRRRMLEDLFQAVMAIGAGALLLWAAGQGGTTPLFDPAGIRSLADLQSAAGLAAGWTGLLVLAWWAAATVSALVSAVLLRCGRRRAAAAVGQFSPAFMRRLAAAALGIQLAAAPLPALASPTANSFPASTMAAPVSAGLARAATAVSGSEKADPGWQPSKAGARAAGSKFSGHGTEAVDPSWTPSAGPAPASLLFPGAPQPDPAPAATVTVRAGDTLWDLAAAQLGPGATDQEVARHWPAWHAANRGVIGPDPHHLLPGQVLAVPAPPAN